MNRNKKLLVFTLSGLSCALALDEVEKILPAVEVNPVPRAPEFVMGIIKVQGRILPVLDIRSRFHLPQAEVDLSDHFILARARNLPVAILVDNVLGLRELDEAEIVTPDELFPKMELLNGVAGLPDGIIYIYDLAKLVSAADSVEITESIRAATNDM